MQSQIVCKTHHFEDDSWSMTFHVHTYLVCTTQMILDSAMDPYVDIRWCANSASRCTTFESAGVRP